MIMYYLDLFVIRKHTKDLKYDSGALKLEYLTAYWMTISSAWLNG